MRSRVFIRRPFRVRFFFQPLSVQRIDTNHSEIVWRQGCFEGFPVTRFDRIIRGPGALCRLLERWKDCPKLFVFLIVGPVEGQNIAVEMCS